MDDLKFFNDPLITNIKYIFYNLIPNVKISLGTSHTIGYRPIQNMFLSICYFFFGTNPANYHFLNIILLTIAVFTIYVFIYRLFRNKTIAFLTSLFYLAHPINGILVNYITANTFSLQLVFMFLSLIFFLNVLEDDRRVSHFPLSILFFVLSIFCHETAMILPLYFVLISILLKKEIKKIMIYVSPYVLILLLYLVFRIKTTSLTEGIMPTIGLFEMNFLEYTASFCKVIVWYITKLFYPHGIVLMWATPVVREHVVLNIIAFILVGLLIRIFLKIYKNQIVPCVACIWFLIGFLPLLRTSILYPCDGFIIEPHWFVFSSVGFFLLLAYLINSYLNIRMIIFMTFSLLLILGGTSYAYNPVWKDQTTYCFYWLKQTPRFIVPHTYLASSYNWRADLYEKAVQTIDILPNDNPAILAFSEIYLIMHNYDKAIKFASIYIDKENNVSLLYSLSGGLLKYNFLDLALKCYEKIIKIDPKYKDAYINIGMIYGNLNRFDEAIAVWKMGSKIDHLDNRFQENITKALFLKSQKNRLEETSK